MIRNTEETGHMLSDNIERIEQNVEQSKISFKMCHVNIQSLGSGEQGPTTAANTKLDQMRTILQHQHNFDVIALSETWLTQATTDDDIALQNYEVHRRDREQGRGGGVCMYVNTLLPTKRRTDLEKAGIEIMWIELLLMPKPILIGVAYRPPGMNRNTATEFIHSLQEILINAINTNPESLFLLGDFNDRCTTWESTHVHSELKQDLIDTSTAIGLHQLIN